MKSIMLCMYYGSLRVGEALVSNHCSDHTLKSENIRLCSREGTVCSVYWKLGSYKHNNDNTFWPVLQREVNRELCPIVALQDYIKIRPRMSGIFFIVGSGQAVFNANILPHLDYCTFIWGNSPHINKLLKAPKRAAWVILDVRDFQTPSSEMFKSLNWMPLRDRVTYRKTCMMYKSLNGLAPVYMSEMFNIHENHFPKLGTQELLPTVIFPNQVENTRTYT